MMMQEKGNIQIHAKFPRKKENHRHNHNHYLKPICIFRLWMAEFGDDKGKRMKRSAHEIVDRQKKEVKIKNTVNS